MQHHSYIRMYVNHMDIHYTAKIYYLVDAAYEISSCDTVNNNYNDIDLATSYT